jgi:hypothetical protein
MKKYIQQHIKNIKTFFYTLVGVNYESRDNEFYIMNKEEIVKIKRLTLLSENLRNHIISYDEFIELKKILKDIDNDKSLKLLEKLKDLELTEEEFFQKNRNFKKLDTLDKSKISSAIGFVTGATMSNQVRIIKKYNMHICNCL